LDEILNVALDFDNSGELKRSDRNTSYKQKKKKREIILILFDIK
jgi:hypothetical protein